MLTVHSKDFCAPQRDVTWSDDPPVFSWVLHSRHGMDRLVAERFQFTFPLYAVISMNKGRFTVIYDQRQVKASPRSLRVYGSEVAAKVVRAFSLFAVYSEQNEGLLQALDAKLRNYGLTIDKDWDDVNALRLWDFNQ